MLKFYIKQIVHYKKIKEAAVKTWQDLGLHFLISSLLGGIYFFLSKDILGGILIFSNGFLLDIDHLGRLRQILHSLRGHKINLQTQAVSCRHLFHSRLWLVVEIGVGYFLINNEYELFGSLLFISYAIHMVIDALDKENLKLKNNRLPADIHDFFIKK